MRKSEITYQEMKRFAMIFDRENGKVSRTTKEISENLHAKHKSNFYLKILKFVIIPILILSILAILAMLSIGVNIEENNLFKSVLFCFYVLLSLISIFLLLSDFAKNDHEKNNALSDVFKGYNVVISSQDFNFVSNLYNRFIMDSNNLKSEWKEDEKCNAIRFCDLFDLDAHIRNMAFVTNK